MKNNNYSDDYKKGFQEGQKNNSIKVAIKMLNKDLDKELVKEISELNDQQLLIIQETLAHNQHEVDELIHEYQTNNRLK